MPTNNPSGNVRKVNGAISGGFMAVGCVDAEGGRITEAKGVIFGNGGNDDIRSGGAVISFPAVQAVSSSMAAWATTISTATKASAAHIQFNVSGPTLCGGRSRKS